MGAPELIEIETKAVQGGRHIIELQSFRGIAALIVLIHHCSFYYRYSDTVKAWSETVLNAHAAVVSFYVLSGFVLAVSLTRHAPRFEDTMAFFLRRVFRIYPMLWVACLLGTSYLVIFRSTPASIHVSDWWLADYRDDFISRTGVVAAFLGFGNELPLPIWSITVELIGSVMMPWLAFSVIRKPPLFFATMLALLVLSFRSTTHTNLVYLVQFSFGASILWWAPRTGRFFSSPASATAAAIVATLFLIFGRQLGGWSYATDYHSAAAALLEGAAATMLIGIIYLNRAPFALLRSKTALFFGNISFSLYLLHLPIMGFVAALLGEWMQLWIFNGNGIVASVALAICTAAITIPLSALSYRYIEMPSIRFGARLLRSRGRAEAGRAGAASP